MELSCGCWVEVNEVDPETDWAVDAEGVEWVYHKCNGADE